MAQYLMPDGQSVELPDNASPELKELVRKKVNSQQLRIDAELPQNAKNRDHMLGEAEKLNAAVKHSLAQSSMFDRIGRAASLTGSAAVRGVAGLGALIPDVVNAGNTFVQNRLMKGLYPEELAEKKLELGGYSMPASAAVSRFGTQPHSPTEKYASEAVQGAAGAVVPMGGASTLGKALLSNVGQKLAVGAAGGLGGEAAGQFTATTSGPDGNPFARLAGSLLAGGLTGAATSMQNSRKEAARQATRELLPEDYKAAATIQARNEAMGVPTALSQAVPEARAAELRRQAERLVSDRNAPELTNLFAKQPERVLLATNLQMGGLPGTVVDKGTAIAQAQKAATDRFTELKSLRTKQFADDEQRAYDDLARILDGPVAKAKEAFEGAAARLNNSKRADKNAYNNARAAYVAKLAEYKEKLQLYDGELMHFAAQRIERNKAVGQELGMDAAKAASLAPSGDSTNTAIASMTKDAAETALEKAATARAALDTVPLERSKELFANLTKVRSEHAGTNLENLVGDFQQRLHDPTSGKLIQDRERLLKIIVDSLDGPKDPALRASGNSIGTLAKYKEIVLGFRDSLGKVAEPTKYANERYKQFSEVIMDPAYSGPLGRVAGPQGFDPKAPPKNTEIFKIFDEGVAVGTPVGSGPIAELQQHLSQVPGGNKSFQDAAVTWLNAHVETAAKSGGTGVNPTIGETLAKKLFGTETSSAGTAEVIHALAKSRGAAPGELLKGFKVIEAIWRHTSNKPPSLGKLPFGEIDASMRNPTATAVQRVGYWAMLRHPAQSINDYLERDSQKFLQELFTSAKGTKLLEQMAKEGEYNPRSAALLAGFLSSSSLAAQTTTKTEESVPPPRP